MHTKLLLVTCKPKWLENSKFCRHWKRTYFNSLLRNWQRHAGNNQPCHTSINQWNFRPAYLFFSRQERSKMSIDVQGKPSQVQPYTFHFNVLNRLLELCISERTWNVSAFQDQLKISLSSNKKETITTAIHCNLLLSSPSPVQKPMSISCLILQWRIAASLYYATESFPVPFVLCFF